MGAVFLVSLGLVCWTMGVGDCALSVGCSSSDEVDDDDDDDLLLAYISKSESPTHDTNDCMTTR